METMNPDNPNKWRISDGIAGLLMIYFTLPKLFGFGGAVEGFQVIAAYVGLDPDSFRLFVGVQEAVVGAILLTSVAKPRVRHLRTLGMLLLLGTMGGAIFTELVIRPGEDILLTVMGLVIGGYAAFRLLTLTKPYLALLVGKSVAVEDLDKLETTKGESE